MKAHIMIISRHVSQSRDTAVSLKSFGFDVSVAKEVPAGSATKNIDAVVIEVGKHQIEITGMIESIQKANQALPVIVLAHDADVQGAISAMHAGAMDYLIAPVDEELLEKKLRGYIRPNNSQVASKASVHRMRRPERTIIYHNRRFEQVIAMARKVAPSMATVLIHGESGTGKEVLARFIHAHSRFSEGPYVAVNCAALPENLAESELFGHEKGAFTGASGRKAGKFEMAHNGTLVLDEISEMPLALQAKLLRALQERCIDRIGGSQPVSVNTRVIAISNTDLRQAVKENRFREDLYYRINVIKLIIPPLRERTEDIPLLVEYFLNKIARLNEMPTKTMDSKALNKLCEQPWPGNVRELENTMERAFLLADGEVVQASHLLLEEPFDMHPNSNPLSVGMSVREMEKELIFKTLENVNNNRTRAAEILDISIRTLRNKLKEYEQAS